MTELKIYKEHPSDWTNQAENYIDSEDICLYLANLRVRKNINIMRLARLVNYYHVCELLCYYGQMHQKGFLDRCDGGDNQSSCRIDWVLKGINIFR